MAISLGREALSVIKASVTIDLGMFSVRVTRALPLISRLVFIVTSIVLTVSRFSLPVKDFLLVRLLLLGVAVPPTVSMPYMTQVMNTVSRTRFIGWAKELAAQVILVQKVVVIKKKVIGACRSPGLIPFGCIVTATVVTSVEP